MSFATSDDGRKRRISKRRVVLIELNIVSQPHSLDRYLEAFLGAYIRE